MHRHSVRAKMPTPRQPNKSVAPDSCPITSPSRWKLPLETSSRGLLFSIVLPICPSSFLFSHLPFRLPRLLLSRFLYRRSTVYTKVRIYSNLTVLFYLFSIDWNESASHGLGWSIESWNVDPLSWWAAYRIKSGSSVAILVQHFNDTVDLAEGTSAAQSRSFHRDRITNYNRARESRSNDRKQLRDPATLSTPLYSFIVTRER